MSEQACVLRRLSHIGYSSGVAPLWQCHRWDVGESLIPLQVRQVGSVINQTDMRL
jgi:hypothetical protein